MGAKILVVDDSPAAGSTLGWILSDRGHGVRVAQDGLSALSAMRSFAPDLVLLDIIMPHMDGVQLCEVIRRDLRYASLPIIMISGLSDRDNIRRAMEAGADSYITKPFDDGEVLEAIEWQLAKVGFVPSDQVV
jgi:DNA-binding response OmpR family regulator